MKNKTSICFSSLNLLSAQNDVEGLKKYIQKNRRMLTKEDWKLISSLFSLDEDFMEENFEYLNFSIILTKNKLGKKTLYLIAQEKPQLLDIIFLNQDIDEEFFLFYQDKVSREILSIYNLLKSQQSKDF